MLVRNFRFLVLAVLGEVDTLLCLLYLSTLQYSGRKSKQCNDESARKISHTYILAGFGSAPISTHYQQLAIPIGPKLMQLLELAACGLILVPIVISN